MNFDERIYLQATRGSARNPKGLPPVLSSLVTAQAAHETANFTSNIFRNYNNAFGYSYVPGAVYQTGSGSVADNGQPVAAYATVEDSVREMVDWIYRRISEGKFPADLTTITTPEQYAQLLKNAGYYSDTVANYTAGIKQFFIRVMQELQKPPVSIITLVALGIAFYWILKKRK